MASSSALLTSPSASWPARDSTDPVAAALSVEIERSTAVSGDTRSAALVVDADGILCEHYWHGAAPDICADAFSMSKSVFTTLVGCAITDGLLKPDDRAIDLLTDHVELGGDPAKCAWTVRQLAGLCEGLPIDNDLRQRVDGAEDMIDVLYATPLEVAPGERFAYGFGLSVLWRMLERACGMRVEAYAQQRLFGPLGIQRWAWLPFVGSREQGALFGLHLSARDFARIGLLYLADGHLGDQVLIDPEWLAMARGEMLSARGRRYGWGWWQLPDLAEPHLCASGHRGQKCFLCFERGLVILWRGAELGEHGRPCIEQLLSLVEAQGVCGGEHIAQRVENHP